MSTGMRRLGILSVIHEMLTWQTGDNYLNAQATLQLAAQMHTRYRNILAYLVRLTP